MSDIHANVYALEAALGRCPNVDKWIVLGDLIGAGLWPNETLRLIRNLNATVIMGNHDHALVTGECLRKSASGQMVLEYTRRIIDEENLYYLRNLPHKIEQEGYLMFHGGPLDYLNQYFYPETHSCELEQQGYKFVLSGHTHRLSIHKIDQTVFINPGSIGMPLDGSTSSLVLLDEEAGQAQAMRYSYNKEKVVMEYLARGFNHLYPYAHLNGKWYRKNTCKTKT